MNAISQVLGARQLRLVVTMPRAVAAVPVRTFSRSAWVRIPAAAAKSKKVSATSGSKKKAVSTKSVKRTVTRSNKNKTAATPRKKATKSQKPAKKPAKKAVKKSTVKIKTPAQQLRADIRALKTMALYYGPKSEKSPKTLPVNRLALFVTQNYPKGTGKPRDKLRQLTAEFQNLSAPEMERLSAQAKANLARNQQVRKDWILSHPPEAIYLANLARSRLTQKIKPKHVPLLQDDRLPKGTRSPFALYLKPRLSTLIGEESNTQAFKTLAQEWNALSATEKKPFEDMSAAESRKAAPLRQELRLKAKVYWEKHYKGLGPAVRVTFPRL